MARDRSAEYRRRDERAKAAGFSGYSEQRRLRAKVAKVVPGRNRSAVAARDRLALETKTYQPGSMTRGDLQALVDDILDSFDLDDVDYEQDWFEWLDELSPKGE